MNELPEQYRKWFKGLWIGTTDHGRQELIAANDKYCLIKMKFRGSFNRGGSGTTMWVVAINGQYGRRTPSFTDPKTVWEKEGRLFKSDKQIIEEKYGLIIPKKEHV